MMGHGWDMSGGAMVPSALAALLLLAAVAAGVVLLVRHLGAGSGWDPRPRPDPYDVLAARFARGEIDEPEYRHRLEVLDEQADRPLTGP